MKIKKLEVDGFRSLVNFEITFDKALTIIVGENDSGKTSLIECLKVITQGRQVESDDLTIGRDDLNITIEVDDFLFKKSYKRTNGQISEESFTASPTEDFLDRTKSRISSDNFDITLEDDQSYLKSIAQTLGLVVRSNSNLENLRNTLIDMIENRQGPLLIENAKFPRFNNIQLDGRQFENVPAFFKEVFIKDKQASLWQEPIDENITIESFVRTHLQEYSNQVTEQIRERGILDKLKIFLRDLTDIKVEPVFFPRDLNVEAKVKFLENGNEINIDNKGDGTKRRITMALLEFKKDQSLLPNDNEAIYLLDEPDTHLHVKAQLELVETVTGFASAGNQVILTTHSPFIVNAVKPDQIRLLSKPASETSIKFLRDDTDYSARILQSLGVENIHLFFSRQIIVVEGETEEEFITALYLATTGRTLSSSLIKVINVQGVHNVSGFARAILEFHDPSKIYILCDNDFSQELNALMEQFNVLDQHKFYVGTQEFEDAFEARELYQSWFNYHESSGRQCPQSWTEEAIQELKLECLDGKKFSKELKALNQGGKKMTKPILGKVLGNHVKITDAPEPIVRLFNCLLTT